VRRAIRNHAKDFAAILALFSLAGFIAFYILDQQRLRFPVLEAQPFRLKAEFSTAQAITPGQGQTVRIAGVRIGDIGKAQLRDGRAIVTLDIDEQYKDVIHTDATALLRPKTGLKDMFVELNPGTKGAPLAREGFVIPVSNTLPDVNPDEILAGLDADTRSYVRLLLDGAGKGLRGNGDELREVWKRFEPLHRDLARVTTAIAERRRNLRRLVTMILDTAIEFSNATRGTLAIFKEKSFNAELSRDRERNELRHSDIPTLGSVLMRVNETGEVVLIDDTLARKTGKGISLATMHHDPLRSSARKPFCSFGHVWVVLALWVPLPIGTRGFALPVLFRLYVGAKRGGRADAPGRRRSGKRVAAAEAAHAAAERPTKLDLARELVGVVAAWAGERTVYLAADGAYAGRALLESRPPNVELVGPLRMDAALWARPGRRRPGQKGRPRRRGWRLPTPKAMAATRRRWEPVPVTLYGRAVRPLVFELTALWYHALRDHPLRIAVVRDPGGHRRDQAFFCTDLGAEAAFVLETYARRWTLEVAFHDAKQCLGLEDPQQQASRAVQRTAPLAGLVYDLVLLWYAAQVRAGCAIGWPVRPWYRAKTAPSFLDILTAARHASLPLAISALPYHARRLNKPTHHSPGSLPAAA